MTQFFQLLLKIAQTAGGPQNDPHGVASSHWLYKPLKIGQESRVLNFLGLASASNFSSASRPSRTFVTNVENAAVNRWAREACNPRHQADAATTKRQRFGSRKAPSTCSSRTGATSLYRLRIARSCAARIILS